MPADDHGHPVGHDQPQPAAEHGRVHLYPGGLQYRLGEVDLDLAEHRGHGEVLRDHPAAVPAGRPEDPGDHPAAVQPHRLRGRDGQVHGQLGELAERPGGEGPLDPFGMLVRGEPPVAHRVAEHRYHAVAVRVGRAQVAGRRPWAHGPELIVCWPVRHAGVGCAGRRRLCGPGWNMLPIGA